MAETVRILIVDDEDVVILSVKRILSLDKKYNYEIDFCYSAEEGLEKSLQHPYDIIITDIVMPGMDGMELLGKFVENNVKALIIMFTGYATMKTALQALKIGAFDFIAKPFTSDELCSCIHRALITDKINPGDSKNIIEEKNIIKPHYVYTIPGHTWAMIKEDRSVIIGLEEDYLHSADEIAKLEIVNEGEHVYQGQGFGTFASNKNVVRTLRSPFSGQVVSVNNKLISNPLLMFSSSYDEGWLIHIKPKDLESEVGNLVLAN